MTRPCHPLPFCLKVPHYRVLTLLAYGLLLPADLSYGSSSFLPKTIEVRGAEIPPQPNARNESHTHFLSLLLPPKSNRHWGQQQSWKLGSSSAAIENLEVAFDTNGNPLPLSHSFPKELRHVCSLGNMQTEAPSCLQQEIRNRFG